MIIIKGPKTDMPYVSSTFYKSIKCLLQTFLRSLRQSKGDQLVKIGLFFFFFCYCLYLLLCVESKVPNFWYKKLYFGHISKFKQIFWTFDNSIFHKLYLRCIAMGWARSATATAACRCLRKKTFSGASIEHRFHVLPCIYNYLDNKCVK